MRGIGGAWKAEKRKNCGQDVTYKRRINKINLQKKKKKKVASYHVVREIKITEHVSPPLTQ